jgi:cytochrome P450
MQQASFSEPSVQRCPFQLIARLQQEAPVYQDPVSGFFVISRYDDIVHVSQHPELFSNTTTVIVDRKDSPVANEVITRYRERGFLPMHTLVTNDPPSHSRYRSLVDKVFTATFIRNLEPHIVELTDGIIDEFAPAGAAELLGEFAVKLPMYVITEQLGMPRSDWKIFKLWSDLTIEGINPTLAAERELQITDQLIEMQQYLWRRAQEYVANPAPTLLSTLAHSQVEGRPLEPRELISIAHQLLVAGNETTSNGIATGVWMLLQNTPLKERLQSNRELLPNFVEEVLRLHAPSPHLYRLVLSDTQIGGVTVKKGSVLMLSYLAGNHDPCKFTHPDDIDLDRSNGRQHLAFGRGIHYCIGNQLARSEMCIAFERLLTRLPGLRLDPDRSPQFAAIYHVRGLEELRVLF